MKNKLTKTTSERLKKYPKHQLYRRQTDFQADHKASSMVKRYLVELNSFGDINKSLIDIFLLFSSSIHEIADVPTLLIPCQSLNFNKIFRFCVKLYFLHSKFVKKINKISEEELITSMEIRGSSKIHYVDSFALNSSIKILAREVSQEVEAKYRGQLNKNSKVNYLQKLEVIEKLYCHQKNELILQILNITDPLIKNIYIPQGVIQIEKQYLQDLIQNIINLQFTSKIYKKLKFFNFVERSHKDYFQLQFLQSAKMKATQMYPSRIITKRYTNSQNEYLITINNLVKLRKKNGKVVAQSFQACRQLMKELVNYKNSTKCSYPLLTPHSIIFNQLSLCMQLSFENPLLQSLGLLKRPTNIENRICFKATPQPFDTYACWNEIENPHLFYNHLFGIDKILREENYPRTQHLQQELKLEQMKERQTQKSLVWRYMMISSLIMNNQQYYKLDQPSKIKDCRQFSMFLKRQTEEICKITQNSRYYTRIFGREFMALLGNCQLPHYAPTLAFLQQLYGQNGCNDDSVIQSFKSCKFNKFIKLLSNVVRQILCITQKCKQFSKIFNSIKYFIRFYFGIFLDFSLMLAICKYCQTNLRKGLQFLNSLKQQIFDRDAKLSYIESSYLKFTEYMQRYLKHGQQQMKYLLTEYNDQYQLMNKYYKDNMRIKSKLKEMSLLYGGNVPSKKQAICRQDARQIAGQIEKELRNIASIGKNLIERELLCKQKKQNEESKYIKLKLNLLTETCFYLNFDNLGQIQSLILGAVNFQESYSHKNDIHWQMDYRKSEQFEYALEILKDYENQEKGGQNQQLFNIKNSKFPLA